MKAEINTDNYFKLSGTIIRINIYGKDNSAANIVIGMADDTDGAKSVKFFNKDVIPLLHEGMPIDIYGHIGSNCYADPKTGEKKYHDNNDLIADVIEIRESKKESMSREIQKIYGY